MKRETGPKRTLEKQVQDTVDKTHVQSRCQKHGLEEEHLEGLEEDGLESVLEFDRLALKRGKVLHLARRLPELLGLGREDLGCVGLGNRKEDENEAETGCKEGRGQRKARLAIWV